MYFDCSIYNIFNKWFTLKIGYIEFAWKEYYADAIHSDIVNVAG